MRVMFYILFIIMIFSAVPAVAEDGVVTRFGKWLDGKKNLNSACPACPEHLDGMICPDTPLEQVKRPPFEIEIRSDIYSTPSGGTVQFNVANFSITGKHNFSPVLNVYGSYSSANIEKNDYDNSIYDPAWHYQSIIAGVGWYIHPVIEIFAGIGKVFPKNDEGTEELAMAIERGIRGHWMFNKLGYKFTVALISREVPLADEGTDINRSSADGTITTISAGVSLPVGW